MLAIILIVFLVVLCLYLITGAASGYDDNFEKLCDEINKKKSLHINEVVK